MSAKIAPPPVPPLRGGDAFGRASAPATSATGESAAAGTAAAGSSNPPQSAALSTSAPASMAAAPAAPMPTSAPVGGMFATSPTGTVTPSVAAGIAAARRPSPWHELAHSLSTTSLRTRTRTPSTPPAPTPPDSACGTESQALRDWDRLVAAPDSDAVRHALVTSAGSGSPSLYASSGAGSPTPSLSGTVPKLAAERDKEGHIEYKLKLIDPSPERFERLVTQMMWRLKQGRNEAIYELGLADDGTVIGLTRPEMDASLRTLERMASEVGATVIVLKEIVLTAPVPPSPTTGGVSTPAWLARRPDLDDLGRPRKGTRGLNGVVPEFKSRRDRRREAAEAEALDDDTTAVDDDSDTSAFSLSDPPAFHLDSPPVALPDPAVRAEQKRRKSAARREQRRLDLLRGDGTSPSPLLPAGLHQALEHQPARPSSLRLSTYVAPSAGSLEAATAATARAEAEADAVAPNPDGTLGHTQPSRTPDDAFVDSLRLPLDRLSLSFADVRTDKDESQGVYDVYDANDAHDELICVEALVVRKPQGDEWEYGGDDDGWGLSVGEEDGWGFGEE